MRLRFLYPYWHARMYADRSKIPADALSGYLAPLAKPGLLNRVLSILRTWKQDLRELETVLPRLENVPTLLLWGGEDRIVYASSAQPLPYEECPEEFNRALIEYLTRQEFPA
jgi:pimeloyl-ACP methyl ester carboxylesterase